MVSKILPDKILYVEITRARSKVKSRSHHDVAHLHPPTSVPTKYQLPTPYGLLMEIQPSKLFRHPNAHPDTMGENNTRTDLKGCGVTTIFDLLINMHKRILGIYEYDISIAIN